MRNPWWMWGALVAVASSVAAGAQEPDYRAVSDLLFPATAKWVAVSSLKAPGPAYLKKREAALRAAYLQAGLPAEDDGCPLLDRLFAPGSPCAPGFHLCDADGDGRSDLLYTGPNPCGEGRLTLLWYGTKEGFAVRQSEPWPVLALRLSPGPRGKFASVSIGCCSSVIDQYFVGGLANPREESPVRVAKETQLPARKAGPEPFVSEAGELVLRASPLLLDDYDPARSQAAEARVFGNILLKAGQGCGGRVAGRGEGPDGAPWYFVVLDPGCRSRRTLVSYDVEAGWVRAEGVTLQAP